jgi:hypothetical protein
MDRWLGTTVMGLVAVGVLVTAAVALLRDAMPLPIALLFVVIAMLFGWAASYSWRTVRHYRRVTWVLENVPPIDTVAAFVYAEPDSVRLSLPSSAGAALPHWYVPCALPAWVSELGPAPLVKAHIDPQAGGPIVVVTGRGIIWPLIGSPCTMIAAHRPASSSNPFRLLEQRLAEQGFVEAARKLADISAGTYTSSSELLGDYGQAMKAVRVSCWRHMDRESRQAYAAAAKAVHKGWPSMRL